MDSECEPWVQIGEDNEMRKAGGVASEASIAEVEKMNGDISAILASIYAVGQTSCHTMRNPSHLRISR
jgi:hypothetical protein